MDCMLEEANGGFEDNLLNMMPFEDSGMAGELMRGNCINGTNIAVAYCLMEIRWFRFLSKQSI